MPCRRSGDGARCGALARAPRPGSRPRGAGRGLVRVLGTSMAVAVALTALSALLSGAMLGFLHAWVCSTMWGLDAADPRVAIAAMQAMNASVRNAAFAPAFFGTAPVLLAAGALAWRAASPRAGAPFLAAALAYLLGGNVAAFAASVPMNEALAAVAIPDGREEAARIWAAYSPRWQGWNQLRAVACGAALLLAAIGLRRLRAA